MIPPRPHDLLCDATRPQLSALLDGSLDPDVARTLQLHLLDCRRCRARLAQERKLRVALARLRDATPAPDTLRERVSEAMRRAERADLEPAR
ncbi:MAG TPA: zf-HC2 domain-containing protein [Gemmatimonadaceae bacterium]|nr:zf-HC2 domain-containing protein [Gemmatimonadaceae bacterium]